MLLILINLTKTNSYDLSCFDKFDTTEKEVTLDFKMMDGGIHSSASMNAQPSGNDCPGGLGCSSLITFTKEFNEFKSNFNYLVKDSSFTNKFIYSLSRFMSDFSNRIHDPKRAWSRHIDLILTSRWTTNSPEDQFKTTLTGKYSKDNLVKLIKVKDVYDSFKKIYMRLHCVPATYSSWGVREGGCNDDDGTCSKITDHKKSDSPLSTSFDGIRPACIRLAVANLHNWHRMDTQTPWGVDTGSLGAMMANDFISWAATTSSDFCTGIERSLRAEKRLGSCYIFTRCLNKLAKHFQNSDNC